MANETVSIRVPKGLPNKLRAHYDMPFSELMRRAAQQLLAKAEETERANLSQKASTND